LNLFNNWKSFIFATIFIKGLKVLKKKHPIEKLIEQGEGLNLDFKFEVSDAAKIARSLVAFANTDGGRLLIGVEDNGIIKGIQSEEEFYVIKNAANNFCVPTVEFSTKEWSVKGKKVLEVLIPSSSRTPHKAPDKDGKLKAFFRLKDENILASGVQMKIWNKQHSTKNINITFDGDYKWLLEFLEKNNTITVEEFINNTGITKHIAEDILSDLIVFDVVEMTVNKYETLFSLK